MKTALYYIRTRCNYSQSMVARELDVSRQIYSAWENGAKPIPPSRKEELSTLFGVPADILDEHNDIRIKRFCDQPVFSRLCRGRQVFSFQPDRFFRVFLGEPDEQRPSEHCAELMSRKKSLQDSIDGIIRFDQRHEIEQLADVKSYLKMLESFCTLLELVNKTDPEYRGRLSAFILEQLQLVGQALGIGHRDAAEDWHSQQTHLLRCRWASYNRKAKTMRKAQMQVLEDEGSVHDVIKLWYERAKLSGWSQNELQWRLNRLLEQENRYEKN